MRAEAAALSRAPNHRQQWCGAHKRLRVQRREKRRVGGQARCGGGGGAKSAAAAPSLAACFPRVLLGAYLFGGVTMLQFHLQGLGVQVPSQWLTALPYVATIVVLCLISRNPAWIRVNMPASLGKPFYPGS